MATLSYDEFVPDLAAEASVVRALDHMQRVYLSQGKLDTLRGPVAELVDKPDPRGVHAHRGVMCRDHAVMLYAATTDCVPLFRLRVEDVGERSNLEFFWMEAAIHGSAGVLRYLAGQGVDVNTTLAKDPHRHTALHWAVYQGREDVAAVLIARPEIDLDRRDARGYTALDLAFTSYRLGTAEQLAAAGAYISPDTVARVARSGTPPALDVVLRHGADPNAYGASKGIAPLHAAVTSVRPDAVRRLLAAGADPGLPTRRVFRASGIRYPRGATPLDCLVLAAPKAVYPQRVDEVRALLTQAIAARGA